VRIGAMVPHRALAYFQRDCLVITPGDREDVIVTVCASSRSARGGPSGLVLSGGIRPHERIVELLREAGLPVFMAKQDSYTVASKIHDMPLRIQPNDGEKIARVQGLVSGHVEVDRIIAALEG
jgi:BioD-like phosphotransacetylase family protein